MDQMLTKLQENLLFPYQLAEFITAAWGGSGSHWTPWLLLPLLFICQAREKLGVGSIGSQTASLFPAEERLKWTFGVTRLTASVQVSWGLTTQGTLIRDCHIRAFSFHIHVSKL